MKLNTDILKKIFRAVLSTREDEISCESCYKQIDEFVEMKLDGKSAEEAMPLVEDHLRRCKDCRKSTRHLLEALQSLQQEKG
ncbi:MAG: hypothetical protein U5K69_03725 [Balneolaceae bacterium]|nr:hypothetical protein [Balneolaceae bacterium]